MRQLDKVYLEITNICNLSCSFCSPVVQKPGMITTDRFQLVLEKLRGKVKTLYFHLKGEPLLHPLLGDFLEMADQAGFAVILTSNGTLLHGRLADLRDKPGLRRINLSLHALSELPDAIRQARLEEIIAAARQLSGTCHIGFRLWNSLVDPQQQATLAFLEGRFGLPGDSLTAALSRKNAAMLAPAISLHCAERFDWPRVGLVDFGTEGFCRGLRDQAGILLDGSVVPCCLDADGIINLGNIYNSDWDSIIQSPRAQAIYQGFSQRRVAEELCRACSYRSRF